MTSDTQVRDDELARTILRPVRGCATDSQYIDALERAQVALATVRKEVWEAAFKVQCADCAEGSTPTFDQDARWYYHGLGHAEVGCSASKLRIAALEASANQKEGMNG